MVLPSTVQEMTDVENDQVNEIELSLNLVLQMLIPHEVVRLLFNRLKLADRLSARCVCSLWTSFVDNTLDISPSLADESAPEVLKFGSTGVELRRLIVSKLHTFQYPNQGLGFSRIRELLLVPYNYLTTGISEVNLARILEDYSDIEELCLNSSVFMDVKYPSILETVQLNFLKDLQISAYNGDGPGFRVTVDILHNIFPSLKSADICLINREENQIQTPLYYYESYRFLANHASTLDKIILSHQNHYNERLLQGLELELDHSIPTTEYSDLLDKMENIQLSRLTLEITHYEGRSRFQFGIRLLKAQANLTFLRLVHIAHPNIAVWNAVPHVLRKCSETLREISIQGCFCPPEAGMIEQFSCSCLKNCGQLTVIQIDICGLQITDIEDLPTQTRVLSLGEMLAHDQIIFLANNLVNLEAWKLLQGLSQLIVTIPKVTVEIFKEVVKLPLLTILVLRKRSCALKRIRRIISYTPGIEEVPADYETQIKIKLDRSRFDPNRL